MAAVAITDTQALLGRLRVVREQRVTTTDGRVWYVRRRWAKRQLPWKRQPDHELSPAERDTVPILPDIDDAIGPLGGLFFSRPRGRGSRSDRPARAGSAGGRRRGGAVVRWVVPFMVANAVWIGLALAASAALVLVDRLTRPWFIEAESARLFHPPRRIWRVHGWWRSQRVFQAVVAAAAEGRIDSEHGVIVFSDRSKGP
jgi:hypothetical protein